MNRYKIGQITEASFDEDYSVKYGTSGDQIGYELHARPFYIHNNRWKMIYRCTSSNIADKIAENMEDAVVNGNIGYSQTSRKTLLRTFILAGMDMRTVDSRCNCDCASLAYTAIMGATGYQFYVNNNDAYMISADDTTADKKPGHASKITGDINTNEVPVVRQICGYNYDGRSYTGYLPDINSQESEYQFEPIYSTECAPDIDFSSLTPSSGIYTVNGTKYIDLTKGDNLKRGDILITFTSMDVSGMTGGHVAVYV